MLQEALVLLWGTMSGRLLTRASYDALGHDGRSGLAVAMATKADATLADLPDDRQRVARRIFLRLVQFGEGRPDTRRQLGVDDLRAESDDPGAFDDLLQHLIANRLLTPSTDEVRGQRVDIAHEMLIIGWPASRDWVESRRQAEKTRRRLVAKAEEWVRLGRGEGGLLDQVEVAEAEAWLDGPDASDLGIDSDLNDLSEASRRAIRVQKRRKRRGLTIAIGGLIAALIAISSFAYWGERQREDAVNSKAAALKKADEAKASAAELSIEAGSTALANGHSFDAMHRFASAINMLAVSSPHQEKLRQSLGHLARETPRLEATLEVQGGIKDVGFVSDSTSIVTVSEDGKAGVWDTTTGKLLFPIKGEYGKVVSASLGALGRCVVARNKEGKVRVLDTRTGEPLPDLKGQFAKVISASICPSNFNLVAVSDKGKARVWNALTGDPLPDLKGEFGKIYSASFDLSGNHLLTWYGQRNMRVWDTRTGDPLPDLERQLLPLFSASLDSAGSRVVTVSQDGEARVWDTRTGQLAWEFPGDPVPDDELDSNKASLNQILSARFSPRGFYAITVAAYDIRLWQAVRGAFKLLPQLNAHAGTIVTSEFSPDDFRIISTSFDGTARIWNTSTGGAVAELKGLTGPINCATFNLDGSRLLTATRDGTVRIWSVCPATESHGAKGVNDNDFIASFGADGLRKVTVSPDGTARVSDDDTKFQGLRAYFNSDHSRVIAVSQDHPKRWSLYDPKSPEKPLAELHRKDLYTIPGIDQVGSVSFSPDGARIVVAYMDGKAFIWNAITGELDFRLEGDDVSVTCASFNFDGSLVVTASFDKKARIWNVNAEKSLLVVLEGHTDKLNSAAFSTDGSRIITSDDHTVRVWDATSGLVLAEFNGHNRPIKSAAFSVDGCRIVTRYTDNTARVWDFEALPGDAAMLPLWVEVLTGTKLDGRAVRGLTGAEWNQRRAGILQAKPEQVPPVSWFARETPQTAKSTGP
jgi:WD40 repeat protein